MNRFREEMKMIPRGAWALAAGICLGIATIVWMFVFLDSRNHMFGMRVGELLIFLPIFVLFFFYILLIGYIYADARRRGMRPLLWALLAMFIPNMIGIILYFILRSPLLRSCPQCGASSSGNFAFCPSCGGPLSAACPSCRNAVEPGWQHCPKCGSALRTPQTI